MVRLLHVCDYLVGVDQRRRWAALVVLAFAVSILEAVGALLVFALLGLVTSPSTSVNVPLLGQLSPETVGGSRSNLLLLTTAFVAAFFLVRGVVFFIQTYALHRLANNAGVRLSRRLLESYLHMPYVHHLQRNSAEMIRNAHESVDVIARFVFVPAVTLAAQALLVLGIALVLLVTAPLVTLLAVVVLGPLVALILRLTQPRLALLGNESQDMANASLKAAQQSLHGVRDVILLGRQAEFEAEFTRRRARLARAYYLQATLVGLPRVALETVFVLFVLAFIAVTAATVESVSGAFAILGLFAYAVLRLLPALNQTLSSLSYLKYGMAAAEDVYTDLVALENTTTVATPEDEVAPLPLRHAIEVAGVTFTYPGALEPALRTVDLIVRRGESIGIVGPTGGGKSTLVDIMIGLLEPDAGLVSVDGLDVASHRAAWQRNIGVVNQSVFLLDDSLRTNIAFGVPDAEVDDTLISEAVALAQLEDFVSSLPEGLDTFVGERGMRISGGQRQRVAIARALYRHPAVIVFDEGTSALDNVTEAELVRALEGLRGDRTLLHVAHRLTTVKGCDRIIVVDGGHVVEEGTYDELLTSDTALRRLLG